MPQVFENAVVRDNKLVFKVDENCVDTSREPKDVVEVCPRETKHEMNNSETKLISPVLISLTTDSNVMSTKAKCDSCPTKSVQEDIDFSLGNKVHLPDLANDAIDSINVFLLALTAQLFQ